MHWPPFCSNFHSVDIPHFHYSIFCSTLFYFCCCSIFGRLTSFTMDTVLRWKWSCFSSLYLHCLFWSSAGVSLDMNYPFHRNSLFFSGYCPLEILVGADYWLNIYLKVQATDWAKYQQVQANDWTNTNRFRILIELIPTCADYWLNYYQRCRLLIELISTDISYRLN